MKLVFCMRGYFELKVGFPPPYMNICWFTSSLFQFSFNGVLPTKNLAFRKINLCTVSLGAHYKSYFRARFAYRIAQPLATVKGMFVSLRKVKSATGRSVW